MRCFLPLPFVPLVVNCRSQNHAKAAQEIGQNKNVGQPKMIDKPAKKERPNPPSQGREHFLSTVPLPFALRQPAFTVLYFFQYYGVDEGADTIAPRPCDPNATKNCERPLSD